MSLLFLRELSRHFRNLGLLILQFLLGFNPRNFLLCRLCLELNLEDFQLGQLLLLVL